MALLQDFLLIAFPVLVLIAALRDATSYIIPNRVTLALVVAFAGATLAWRLPLGVIGAHLAVGAVVLILGMGLFAARWLGGGDVKFFAAVALWLGWPAVLDLILVTAMAGGGLTVILLILRSKTVQPLAAQGPGWFARLATPGEDVPYGLAIATGALAAFSGSSVMLAYLAR
jgi:prepilin peptidase CpaA